MQNFFGVLSGTKGVILLGEIPLLTPSFPISGIKMGITWEPRLTVRFRPIADVHRDIVCAYEIERRPRGASRAKLAPTFVSGQLRLRQARATTLLVRRDIEPCTKAFARKSHRNNWPETNVGASFARDAPRGRRSI